MGMCLSWTDPKSCNGCTPPSPGFEQSEVHRVFQEVKGGQEGEVTLAEFEAWWIATQRETVGEACVVRPWELVWASQKQRGMAVATITPEFGPAPYLHTLPFTQAPVADLSDICDWMARRLVLQHAAVS